MEKKQLDPDPQKMHADPQPWLFSFLATKMLSKYFISGSVGIPAGPRPPSGISSQVIILFTVFRYAILQSTVLDYFLAEMQIGSGSKMCQLGFESNLNLITLM